MRLICLWKHNLTQKGRRSPPLSLSRTQVIYYQGREVDCKQVLRYVPGTTDRIQYALQHESQEQLLGQCRHGALLPESENGMCLAARLRQPCRGQKRCDAIHVGFYNAVRLHSTLGYITPVDYELHAVAKKPIAVSEIT